MEEMECWHVSIGPEPDNLRHGTADEKFGKRQAQRQTKRGCQGTTFFRRRTDDAEGAYRSKVWSQVAKSLYRNPKEGPTF
jgi:hypothetical protein